MRKMIAVSLVFPLDLLVGTFISAQETNIKLVYISINEMTYNRVLSYCYPVTFMSVPFYIYYLIFSLKHGFSSNESDGTLSRSLTLSNILT